MEIIINGISGKMGKTVFDCAKTEGVTVTCGVDRNIVCNVDCPVYKSFDEVTSFCEAVIDFSSPDSLDGLLSFAIKYNLPVVIGTTGYSEYDEMQIKNAAKETAIFKTDNFSLGIYAVIKTARLATEILSDYDVEIIELHHRYKSDAPSGTAKSIINAINEKLPAPRVPVCARTEKRARNELGVHSVRGGDLTGTHEILFMGDGETFSIKHQATNKAVFAIGALKAAKFLIGKKAGLYCMDDLIASL